MVFYHYGRCSYIFFLYLQAYRNSAYHQGQEAYQGSALDIPEPPQRSPPSHLDPALHGKPPLAPRFKTELSVNPEDELVVRKLAESLPAYRCGSKGSSSSSDSGPPPRLTNKLSSGSLGSLSSSDASGSSARELAAYLPLAETQRTSENVMVLEMAPLQNQPPAPVRTSSKNIVLSHLQNLEKAMTESSGSSDAGGPSYERRPELYGMRHDHEYSKPATDTRTKYNSCDNLPKQQPAESFRHSSDNLVNRQPQQSLSKSATTGRLPLIGFRPLPYCRSMTTSALSRPPMTTAGIAPLPLGSPPEIPFQPHVTNPHSFSSTSSLSSTPSDSRTLLNNKSEAQKLREAYLRQNFDGGGSLYPHNHSTDLGRSEISPSRDKSKSDSPSNLRGSSRDNLFDNPVKLVAERMRRFESLDIEDAQSDQSLDMSYSPSRYRRDYTNSTPPRMGFDTVASRVAQFQGAYSDDSLSDSERPPPVRKSSSEERYQRILSDRKASLDAYTAFSQTRPPSEIHKVPATPPAAVSIHFRNHTPEEQVARMMPSPEKLLHSPPSRTNKSEYCREGLYVEETVHRDRSPLNAGTWDSTSLSPHLPRRHRSARRQPSYLTAIHSPQKKGRSIGE